MKTFPVIIRSVLIFLGGLNLQLQDVEVISQNLHNLVSLCTSNTPTKLLLKTIIEYYKLELGADKQIFGLSFNDNENLTTPV